MNDVATLGFKRPCTDEYFKSGLSSKTLHALGKA
jgi:hypothetical protein